MLAAGTRLGPYEVVAPLGAGGMGEVYRAQDPRLRREVAIKVLPPGVTTDPERIARFEQEALAAASLNHPNILSVFDTGIHDGAPYVVSELLDGATVRQLLEGGPLPLRKALDYAAQCARGLAAAHQRGIVHRDLKPENLFVTKDGHVKILDFGLAKLIQREPAAASASAAPTVAATQPGLILGTPGYMSPEQVRGEPADARSDIFSWALVLYEMVSGRRAFGGASTIETLNAILTAEPASLPPTANIPGGVERIVHRCLEKDPDDRFQSSRDLVFGLEALSTDSQPRVAAAARPRSSRFPLWAAAAGLLVIGGIAGAALVAGLGRSEMPAFTRLTFRRGMIDSARFAPDGQTIVYGARWQGGPLELFSTRLGSAEARSLGSSSIESISSTGEMALRLPNGTLARAPLAGGVPREIIEHVRSARWLPDGETLAIVRSSGGRQRIESPPGTVLYEMSGEITDIAVAPDGKSIACVESLPGIGPLVSIGLVDAARTHTILSTGWGAIRGLAWSPRGDEVWFAAAKREVGTGTLVGVTPTGKVRDVVRFPSDLELHDVRPDGTALVARADYRIEARGLAPGETQERDLSWFDYTGLSDLAPDGKTVLITENGEAGFSVYLRPTDGSPAVRMADGGSFGRSPDGRSMIVMTLPFGFMIQPVGPGEPRAIPHTGFDGFLWGNWFPDGRHILLAASETGHGLRLYMEDLDGNDRHPISPEGWIIATGSRAISPDGNAVAAIDPGGRIVIVPVAGGAPRPLPGSERGDLPIQWSPDGRMLYVYRHGEVPTHVYRVDVGSGRRELWRDIGPSDPAGVTGLGHVLLTPDATAYVYNYPRRLGDLFLVTGLK